MTEANRELSAPAPGLRVLIWVVLYTLPAAVALLPVLDYDTWWHLRTGQWVVEHGAVPATDPFSQHGLETGKTWIAYSWLYEVLFYLLYQGLGYSGIFLGRAVLTLAVVAVLHRLIARRESRFVVAMGLMGAALLAMLPLLTDRPWMFSILFSALTLDVVLDLRNGAPTRRMWLLPLLFALWANIHIQFVHGLFLLGLACGAPLLDYLRGQPLMPRWRTLVAVTAASAL